jgi:cell division protein FtsI (penicillin-binding protein 3)
MGIKQPQSDRIGGAYVVYYVMLLLSIFVIAKIIVIQFVRGDELRARSAERSVIISNIRADRGNIYSRDGELIATSLPIFDIFVDFSEKNVDANHFNENYDSLAIYLAKHFPSKSYAEYKQRILKFRKENITYGLLLRNINYHQLQLVRKFPLFRLGRYKGGIIEEKKERRIHPYGWLAQRTIGFSRTDFKVGIEGAYNLQLQGKDGKRLKQRLPNNRYVPLDDNFMIRPVQGVDIVTTLDMRVQDVAESALHEHLKKHEAQWGCAVLMEVATGEIRAIANLEKDENGQYIEKYNHAIGTRYEPGSSFKLFSMMIMLEDGYLDLDSLVNTGSGKIRIGRNEVSDAHPLGTITVREVFEFSSNVGTIMLVRKFYDKNPSKFVNRLFAIRMNAPMGIDIRGEQPAMILKPEDPAWSATSLATMSYGYGLSITPLQLLAYYNAVVNQGKLVRPLFVKEFRSSGNPLKTFQPVILHDRICSEKTSNILMELMEGVVEKGTAKNLKNAACKIGGKTATARIWDQEHQQYTDRYNASFVGYFPADNPKYSCIVVVSKPSKGFYYGGNVAAPVFKDIAEIVYATELEIHDSTEQRQFTGIQHLPEISAMRSSAMKSFMKLMPQQMQSLNLPDSPWIMLTRDSLPSFEQMHFPDSIMPDVKGMNLRDAAFLLESMGCVVRATGKGKVTEQSAPKGSKIIKGQIVNLSLKQI